MIKNKLKLVIAICGIYATFLSWGLVQEPLNTRVWPNSGSKFTGPCFIAICQGLMATLVGFIYLSSKKTDYGGLEFMEIKFKDIAVISLYQTLSAPVASYSLYYVDYLAYILAKSCKLIPIMLVHLLVYRSKIPKEKLVVGVLVSLGVTLFTFGTDGNGGYKPATGSSLYGFLILCLSLFLDGLTNASQDAMLKGPSQKKITGAHLMFALNLLIVVWNIGYLLVCDPNQWHSSIKQLTLDPQIWSYLLTYSICGAIGQCFIFFTLENYSSIVLTTVTVTRKMVSMLLSIFIYGHRVTLPQWMGIIIVFGGITWEAFLKSGKDVKRSNTKEKQT
ncbi:UDP-galactose transporter HUT1 Ecym_2142 [Eremothecium cymbalariae DBVPG|uniref:UDP-galactose transporter homolog 1 n=1 Tax=Eremothecium cymbalariae (strain CBS 270.75 / DBVPG 7215 / KCTC 17166 / NRRL Y-17582) TaxID=931890 RepID=G8JNH8_ERECY|nr:Hypothetical protein Ecym_2142 [Eremothecium cymbalariae DBVPG\